MADLITPEELFAAIRASLTDSVDTEQIAETPNHTKMIVSQGNNVLVISISQADASPPEDKRQQLRGNRGRPRSS